jgi:hypothetical protein
MVRSERIQTFILIGIAFVFILLTIGLGINWLTGHEAHRSAILMILGGLLLSTSLYGFGIPKGPHPADVSGAAVMVAKIASIQWWASSRSAFFLCLLWIGAPQRTSSSAYCRN